MPVDWNQVRSLLAEAQANNRPEVLARLAEILEHGAQRYGRVLPADLADLPCGSGDRDHPSNDR